MKSRTIAALLSAALLSLMLTGCQSDAQTPESTTTPEVSAAPTPEPAPVFLARLDSTLYRSAPEFSEETVLGALPKGTPVTALDAQQDGFEQVHLADGQEVWIYGWYLRSEDLVKQRQREVAYEKQKLASPTYEDAAAFLDAEESRTYTCMANLLNCRADPSRQAPILYQIAFGTELTVLGRDGDFYLCRLKDGGIVYCYQEYLTNEATYVELENAVDLRVFMPTADFEMLFASSNNITGAAMYPAIPLLERETAEMLAQAQEIFRADGYSIKIYDAYRPKSAQFQLYDIVQDSRFIADPYRGQSWHQLGRAIDMSLVNMATGEELEMPTPMHTFSTDASRFSSELWSEQARANSDYMTEVMTSVGFGTITTEWWHFENTAPGNFLDPNPDYDSFVYKPIAEYNGPTH